MAKFFLFCLSSYWSRKVNFGSFPYPQKFKFWKDYSDCFYLLMSISGENLSEIGPCLGVQRPVRGHFMGAELICKTLKICNLTTTNARLMKLTTIVYIHNTFSLGKIGRSSYGVRGNKQKTS